MPTLAELSGLDAQVTACRELCLDFIELNMNLPEYLPSRLDPSRLRELSRETGVGFTLHSPEELDLASIHDEIRAAHLSLLEKTFALASRAAITLVTMHLHSGIYFTLPGGKLWLYDRDRERFLETLHGSFSTMAACARENGITLCIENTGNFHLPHVQGALEQLFAIDGLGLTWDTGHDLKGGSREYPVLMNYRDRIRHIHLHDSDGKTAHLPPGKGSLDLPTVLGFAQERGCALVLEVKTREGLEESVKYLRALPAPEVSTTPSRQ
jgi:sugar phosphate isomerase/epimerase